MNIKELLERDGTIVAITTRTRVYSSWQYHLGMATNTCVAVSKENPTSMRLIPMAAIEEIEVDYGEQQDTIQDTPAT